VRGSLSSFYLVILSGECAYVVLSRYVLVVCLCAIVAGAVQHSSFWVLCLGHTGWLRRGTRTRTRARTQTWHNCRAHLLHLFQSAVLSLSHSLSLACDLRRVTSARHIGWLRPIGCLMFRSHSLQKSPIISGSFSEKDQ